MGTQVSDTDCVRVCGCLSVWVRARTCMWVSCGVGECVWVSVCVCECVGRYEGRWLSV